MALFTETNYYYMKRQFARFFQMFGVEHLVMCIAVMVLVYLLMSRLSKDNRKIIDKYALSASILFEYYYLIALYTIVFRSVYATPQYHLELFWSYQQAIDGSSYLMYEIVLNYIMFIPVGLLFPVVLASVGQILPILRGERHRFFLVVLIAFISSAFIECSQLILRRGLFEFDDIIGNVAGAMIGYGLYKLAARFISFRYHGKAVSGKK